MSHVRQQIRAAAAGVLSAIPSVASVFVNRVHRVRESDLPCLMVTTDDEAIRPLTVGGMVERELDLVIRVLVRATASMDDTLDSLIADVEAALAGNTLGGLVRSIDLSEIHIELSSDLDVPAGEAAMVWKTTYYAAAGSPSAAL